MSKKLYARMGAMNSGKSMNLITTAHNYATRDQYAVVCKPTVDTKSARVSSRVGLSVKVDIHITPDTLVRHAIKDFMNTHQVDCVLVDEIQFCTPDQIDELFLVAVEDDIPVICYGIRTDFRTHFFPGSLRLLEIAHSIEELKTICRCGKKAMFNARMDSEGNFTKTGEAVGIDGDWQYESLCGKCYLEKVGPIRNSGQS